MKPVVTFWFDIVCPYAWVAAQRLTRLEAAGALTIDWRPILLGGVLRAVGTADRPMDAMASPKVAHIEADLQRHAELLDFQFRYPDDHPHRTVDAMRALHACSPEQRPALAFALWEAYWTHNLPVSEENALAPLLARFGLSWAAIQSADVRASLRRATDEAVEAGVFGVPAMQVGERLFWGADRLPAVRAAVGLPPDLRLPTGPLEVFHDFASPYSYLGVQPLLGRPGVTLRPMLLGALFQTIGTPIVPVATFPERKRAWAMEDMNAQAALRGIPFQFTPHFPLRTVLPLRVALQEPSATGPLYEAAWVHGLDIGHAEVVRDVLEHAGLDALGLLEGANDPEVKALLRSNTEEAVRRGVPGAPSFVSGADVFWGQDRLRLIAELEAGGPGDT